MKSEGRGKSIKCQVIEKKTMFATFAVHSPLMPKTLPDPPEGWEISGKTSNQKRLMAAGKILGHKFWLHVEICRGNFAERQNLLGTRGPATDTVCNLQTSFHAYIAHINLSDRIDLL
jgi:hypothetical protein